MSIESDYEAGRTAGCYDNVYVSEDLETALELSGLKNRPEPMSNAFMHGYVIGFFSGYELHEVLNADHLAALELSIAFASDYGFDTMRDD